MKTIILSLSVLSAFALPASAMPRHHRHGMMTSGIAANGRCHGVSYGTGARRCGSPTGGAVGGPGMKN